MSENVTEAGKGLGIASLVLGIIALVISFIPCLGMYALVPGIIAIIFGIVAFMQAKKGNGAKGIIIAGLVVSILGTAIAGWQYAVLASAASELTDGLEQLGEEFKNMNPEKMEALEAELEEIVEGAIEDATEAVEDAEIDVDIDAEDAIEEGVDENPEEVVE